MANTYFELKKTVETPGHNSFSGYINDYSLTLTAFVGGITGNNLQLTIQTQSTLPGQSGVAYIPLNDEDIELLYLGMLERKNGEITATGCEKSKHSPCSY